MSDNTGDIVSKIVEANALESSGDTERAIALYQEILKLDRGGNYGDVAQQALDNLQKSVQQPQANVAGESQPKEKLEKSSFWSKLSIKAKTSIVLISVALGSNICIGTVAYVLANRTIAQQMDNIGNTEQAESNTQTRVDNESAQAVQKQLLQVLVIGTIVSGLAVAALSQLIADRATRPVVNAAEAVKKIGRGELDINLDIKGEDEIATLYANINQMAGKIEDLLLTQEAETNRQRKEKEALQQGVMGLLLDVEGAQQGDLTVRAKITDGAIGSIADAFNTTMRKLRELLKEVQTVSTEVGQLSLDGEGSVRQLSESAQNQTIEINQALGSIDEINQSVATVANYAQEAAKIARNGSLQAKEGDLAMDATVSSIEKIRGTVANTSKKVKQLSESSQEIAQIVEIISGISEKTNLLAFNASVEAARAGEHGEGFRIVAEEVRRLADRITEATKDIQQLVNTIQQDTSSVLEGMETSTSEVVNGSELVHMTKLNLRTLADTSKQIDEYLKYITTSTTDQTNTSKLVNQKISGLATIAKVNSTEAENVVHSLQTLVSEAENLQSSIAQFKLET